MQSNAEQKLAMVDENKTKIHLFPWKSSKNIEI